MKSIVCVVIIILESTYYPVGKKAMCDMYQKKWEMKQLFETIVYTARPECKWIFRFNPCPETKKVKKEGIDTGAMFEFAN